MARVSSYTTRSGKRVRSYDRLVHSRGINRKPGRFKNWERDFKPVHYPSNWGYV
jgi:hypothetical protein